VNRYLAINIEGKIGQPTVIRTSSFISLLSSLFKYYFIFSSTDRYSSDEFELDDEPYSYSESFEYSSLFEPTDEPSTIIQDPEVVIN
jgi:hypothetical protein